MSVSAIRNVRVVSSVSRFRCLRQQFRQSCPRPLRVSRGQCQAESVGGRVVYQAK